MEIKVITKETFETEVLQTKEPVLVDFFAEWCGPCKMLAPILHEIAEEKNDLKICKLDIDQDVDLALEYGVQAVPTMILFRQGEAAQKIVGLCSKDELLQQLNL